MKFNHASNLPAKLSYYKSLLNLFLVSCKNSICLAIILMSGVIQSCHKKNDNPNCIEIRKNSPVYIVEGPDSAKLDETIELKVSFGVFNGCGDFGNFETTPQEDTTLISVTAKYAGCLCTDNLPRIDTVYLFKSTKPGPNYLKFVGSEGVYIRDTIYVH